MTDTQHSSAFQNWRREKLTRRIFRWARGAMPSLSETERSALAAGDVWWDAALFTGSPDWEELLATPRPTLSVEEQAFIDGPCTQLCSMIDDWRINWEWHDLPPEVWAFLRREKFFGMIIAKEYGGLGFSAFGHSTVVRMLSTRSIPLAVTVMVPNSLGPGELLHLFGTPAQKSSWLPRLATGEELPCFGLTSPEAGSDAASMLDTGVVCWGEYQGKRVLGLRLNWHKRYITLGPVATVLGLAFKAFDPEHLLGEQEDLGITVALIPTATPGVEIGRRHLPCLQPFQNGPNRGRDVFAPLDWVIGGQERIGEGWAMLMSALAAGRGISLPSLSAAGAVFSAWSTGAYSRIREQFGIPIGNFEGVQARLARLAAIAYKLDAARQLTCSGLDQGYKLAVISAIMKAHATYDLRTAVDDGMDVQAGKAVIDGPNNLLGNLYRAIPVAITVEGANILTRNLIIFGQGAIRAHPYLLQEITALENKDETQALHEFDEAFWNHVGYFVVNACRAWGRNWSGGLIGPAPRRSSISRLYRQASRYAAAFTLLSDVALLTLGGALKRRELLSARLGDVLSELYLLSAVFKRFADDDEPAEDLPLIEYCFAVSAQTIEERLAQVLKNLPNRPAAWLVKAIIQPLGNRRLGPDDALVRVCAEVLTTHNATRDRLTYGIFCGDCDQPVEQLRLAFDQVMAVRPLRDRMRKAGISEVDAALAKGVVSDADAQQLREAAEAVDLVIAVDDFAPSSISAFVTSDQPEMPPEKAARTR